jgi:hypothetical protein
MNQLGSHWRQVVKRKSGGGKAKRTPGYGKDEKFWEDRWGDIYMGKDYQRPATECVSMFAQGYGGDNTLWATQLRKDGPEQILAFLGYQHELIRGEQTRRALGWEVVRRVPLHGGSP